MSRTQAPPTVPFSESRLFVGNLWYVRDRILTITIMERGALLLYAPILKNIRLTSDSPQMVGGSAPSSILP